MRSAGLVVPLAQHKAVTTVRKDHYLPSAKQIHSTLLLLVTLCSDDDNITDYFIKITLPSGVGDLGCQLLVHACRKVVAGGSQPKEGLTRARLSQADTCLYYCLLLACAPGT